MPHWAEDEITFREGEEMICIVVAHSTIERYLWVYGKHSLNILAMNWNLFQPSILSYRL